MKSKLISITITLIILATTGAFAGEAIKPSIAKESIPADTPEEVKKQIEYLYHYKPLVRLEAVRILAMYGEKSKNAIPFLIDMMHDNNLMMVYDNESEVRTAVGTFVGEEVAATLGAIGAPAVEPLIKELKSDDNTRKKNAVIALGLTGDPRAVEPLIMMINNKKVDDPVISTYVRNTLKSITGVDFGDDRIEWNKWWIKNNEKFKQSKDK